MRNRLVDPVEEQVLSEAISQKFRLQILPTYFSDSFLCKLRQYLIATKRKVAKHQLQLSDRKENILGQFVANVWKMANPWTIQ